MYRLLIAGLSLVAVGCGTQMRIPGTRVTTGMRQACSWLSDSDIEAIVTATVTDYQGGVTREEETAGAFAGCSVNPEFPDPWPCTACLLAVMEAVYP